MFLSKGYLSPNVFLYHLCPLTALGNMAEIRKMRNIHAGEKSLVGQTPAGMGKEGFGLGTVRKRGEAAMA